MTRDEREKVEEMSVKVFGTRHGWKKLRRIGLESERTKVGKGLISRRFPLTEKQAIHYLEKTIEMNEKMIEELKSKLGGTKNDKG